jgi:hypothetical protein
MERKRKRVQDEDSDDKEKLKKIEEIAKTFSNKPMYLPMMFEIVIWLIVKDLSFEEMEKMSKSAILKKIEETLPYLRGK